MLLSLRAGNQESVPKGRQIPNNRDLGPWTLGVCNRACADRFP